MSGRLIEANVLAATRISDQAGFELLDPVPVGIDDRWCNALFAFIGAKHDLDTGRVTFYEDTWVSDGASLEAYARRPDGR